MKNYARSFVLMSLCVLLCLTAFGQKVPGGACGMNAQITTWPTNTPMPAAPTPVATPTGGSATTWGYQIVAKNAAGTGAAGAEGTTAAGAATLTTGAYNTVTWAAVAGETAGFDIYRTTAGGTPSTVGKIGSVAHGATKTFKDDGTVAGTGTPPSLDTSGAYEIIPAPTGTTPIYINGVATMTNKRATHICGVYFRVKQTTTAANFGLVTGTGTNCGTGTAALTPLMTGVASVTDQWPFYFGADSALVAPVGAAVCAKMDYSPTGAQVFVNWGTATR